MKDTVRDRCPYLGLEDDPETALGYPSVWNRCHSVKFPVAPALEHQREICLGADHLACPVFADQGAKTLPKELRFSARKNVFNKTVLRVGVVAVIVLLVVGSSLILSGYWAPSWISSEPTASLVKPVASSTAIPSETFDTDAPEEEGAGVFPSATATLIMPTQTEIAQQPTCAYSLETPIGTTQPLILHQVAAGESMVMLAEDYETTIEAIDEVNYFLPSPLWSELVVIIPSGTTSVDTLSPLKPVFVQYDRISFEEFADNLSMSSSELLELNNLDPSCESFSGWIVIPAEKISLAQ